ncbi:unnamed protein product [Vitrella brassicaformis CCMP3155]|uniref:Uncharacterized protein n=1 Tax=Vitrella brassicaformis (strain CCMP3155) TaxID=1169540 RepID=A0A0G4EJJ9_VITBC|nr:unnamed protein product [Vitrella brassicaformis CCMP3155]|eukprot:CEL97327.1 unnamed protein product [Vitrella brassicaformis CCMP3155]
MDHPDGSSANTEIYGEAGAFFIESSDGRALYDRHVAAKAESNFTETRESAVGAALDRRERSPLTPYIEEGGGPFGRGRSGRKEGTTRFAFLSCRLSSNVCVHHNSHLHEIIEAYRRRIQKLQEGIDDRTSEDSYEAWMTLKAANEAWHKKREEAISRRRGEQPKERAVDEHDLGIDAAVAAFIAAKYELPRDGATTKTKTTHTSTEGKQKRGSKAKQAGKKGLWGSFLNPFSVCCNHRLQPSGDAAWSWPKRFA